METIARSFIPLGFMSFGGPSGNIGLFERTFVDKVKSVTADKFAEILALSSILPGSTSLQLALGLGVQISGCLPGGLMAVLLFSLPGLIIMTLAGKYLEIADTITSKIAPQWLFASAVSVVAVAGLTLFQKVCKTTLSVVLAFFAAVAALSISPVLLPLIALICGGFAAVLTTGVQAGAPLGVTLLGGAEGGSRSESSVGLGIGIRTGQTALGIFTILGISLFAFYPQSEIFNFFAAGASAAGGGAGVVPYLESLVNPEKFLLLFSLAMCLPGPLFNLGAGVGAVLGNGSLAWGLLCWLSLITPGLLVYLVAAPVWSAMKGKWEAAHRALLGMQAAAVGLLLATTVQLYMGTVGLVWTRLFAVVIGMALQVVWDVEPFWVILLGLGGSVLQAAI